ncbi:hypothetical protein [Halobacterium salinarum]|nr:hypothetical protein [Halobacterium salinarum]MDL0127096.1 hypothetical protein [Halobacterium salinarum]
MSDPDAATQQCGRCEEEYEKLHPLDAVVHDEGAVCGDCLKVTDTVVDP